VTDKDGPAHPQARLRRIFVESEGTMMSAETMISTAPAATTIHPRWVRVCHWINALAILVMIGSGWQIYNASPLFDFLVFPRQIALGNWLAGALLWHFAAMWVLVINGVVYVTLGIVTGRFRRKLLPIRPGDVVYVEPGEEHWHGATPDRFMAHVAIQEADDDGQVVTWLDHVTDEEYGA